MSERVLIIGLRVEQARKLKELYKDLEIEYNPDPAKHVAKLNHIDAYNRIIVCTKFTHHSTHHKCKRHPGYKMVSGGYSSVKNLLGESA